MIEPSCGERAHEVVNQVLAIHARRVGVPEQVHKEPLGAGHARKSDPLKLERAAADHEHARALRVVHEWVDVHRGAAEPERVPAGRARDQVGGAVKEGVEERIVGGRDRTEASLLRHVDEAVSQSLDGALALESLGQSRGIAAPTPERCGTVDGAGVKGDGRCNCHGMKSPVDEYR